jgi:aryl-alcohol dehydrogenase-like predicted oxidoreductase
MPLAIDQNIGTVVWSPLSGGQLSGKITRHHPPTAGTRIATQGMRPGLPEAHFFDVIDVLLEVAQQTERSASQVALNWLLQRPTIATVVVGARNEEQLMDNLRASEFVLTTEQLERLDAVSDREPIYPYWHQRRVFGERQLPIFPDARRT